MNASDIDIVGRVVRRYGDPVPFPTASDPLSIDPANCTYDIVPSPQYAGRYAIYLQNFLPLRRISRGCRIIPAEPGDSCDISVSGGKVTVTMRTEAIPFREACP